MNRKGYHFMLDQNLMKDVKQRAKEENRSMSNFVESLLIKEMKKVPDYEIKTNGSQ